MKLNERACHKQTLPMGRPNPNKSGRAKKKTLNKLKEGDARKPLKEGGCPQRTKGIGCTLKKNS